MRLSWNEIRARAARFADDWKDAHYEKGETHSFYNELFEVFGVKRRRVASFEEPVKLLGSKRGFIDLFWKGVLLVEQKSAGRSLIPAKAQALDYFPGLKDAELPRYILLSDFQTFELHDLEEGTETTFTLADLPAKIEALGFILGIQKRAFRDQDPVNIRASELMGKLHDALEASGYAGHDLEQLLVRLLFCLFADDTGIFEPRDIFETLIRDRTSEDGADVGHWLQNLFEVLNTPDGQRQSKLDADLSQFPYVNGALFAERLPIAAFDKTMRGRLLEACEFSWDAISPAIFGSLFQSVMNAKERRASGAHYTTERNILKLIEPLFLDDLKAEFDRLRTRRDSGRTKALKDFHDKLAGLRFLDPACGCGNFLIIAYRELRALETETLKEIRFRSAGTIDAFDVATLSRVDVNQFYGIEVNEFPARIAEVAMWMMDHIMNVRLSLEFGEAYARIPLKVSPHILNADALETRWADLLPAGDCSYVLGNPPFIGQSYQSPAQRAQMARIVGVGRGGSLDYVAAWFLLAAAYVQDGDAQIAFVSTNSITQGEQVAQLWPKLFRRFRLELSFAHRTFPWGSDARGVAHVHVVILGLVRAQHEPKEKRLFSYPTQKSDPQETRHASLSPYLFDASQLADRHLVVADRRAPISASARTMRMGSKIVDDGIYIMSSEERRDFLAAEPRAAKFIVPLVGSVEFINGLERWILNVTKATPAEIRSMPLVAQRVAAVRAYRSKSRKAKTRSLADFPTQFEVTTIPDRAFLAIPKVSSERREYLPIGWLQPPTLPSQLVQIVLDAEVFDFGVLTSRMHMAWLRHIGGRLKSDYQYSIGLVYNAFVWPSVSVAQKARVTALAQAVIDARTNHAGSTLADLYDPDSMPPDLRQAHRDLDQAVDRLYRGAAFGSDRERVEHLFGLYETALAPMAVAAAKPNGRRTRATPKHA